MSALSHGFRIIEVVSAAGSQGLLFAQVVAETGIPKASTHRLLKELTQLGALIYDAGTRTYRGGLLLAKYGGMIIADFDLRRTARPALETLHAQTGHVATLGVLNDLVGVYVDKIEGTDFGIRLHSEVGKQFPLHCTAMGKVLLAHAESGIRNRIMKRKLEAHTPNTITDARQLRRQLDIIREQGVAVDDEEITRGLMCVAAPITGADESVAGAISCTFPTYLAHERGIEPEIRAVLMAAAKQ